MRLVDHLAVDLDDAGSRIVNECLDDFLRPGDLLIGRQEGRIDDIDMPRMDHRLGHKAVLTRGDRFFPKRIEVVDVGGYGVNGNDAGRGRTDQAEVACQQKRAVIAARGPVARSPERCCEIFRTPHHAPQPRTHIFEVEQFQHRPRGLGRDSDDARGTLLDVRRRFKSIEIERQPIDVGGTRAFWQYHTVGPARDNRGKIAKRHAGIERVDTDIDLLARIARIEHLAHGAPGTDLFLRRNRILEIEDQRIGRDLLRVFELAQAVARNEQKRSHRLTLSVCNASGRCGGNWRPPPRADWSWYARIRRSPASAATCWRAWR